MIAIIDYDAGNIRSVENAFAAIGEECVVTRDRAAIERADRVVLPGVGSFGVAMEQLRRYELDKVIREVASRGTPFLGICLGLQLLFDGSEESEGIEGLGILRGRILRIPPAKGLKIPHIGWNSLSLQNNGRLFSNLPTGGGDAYAYFVHSFYLKAEDEGIVTAAAEYGVRIHASVESGNVFACQFHPEKSGAVGLAMLENFARVGA